MRAFVYVGGTVMPDYIEEKPQGEDLVIAADIGLYTARRLGVTPTLLMGDFDSELTPPAGIERYTYPCRKDETDGQLAVREAVRRGADTVLIIGGLDGRLDHTLSCISMLEELYEAGVRAVLTNGQNRVRFLRNGTARIARSSFPYFGLVTPDREARGITLQGCRYPLQDAVLTRRVQYAVSNVIEAAEAVVTVQAGTLYLIESRDSTFQSEASTQCRVLKS